MDQTDEVVYEVNVAVDAGAAEAYAEWLRRHMDEVLSCAGFLSAELLRVEDAGADGRVQLCVRYRVASRAALEDYFAGPAAALRADGEARFGGRFSASRRVLRLA